MKQYRSEKSISLVLKYFSWVNQSEFDCPAILPSPTGTAERVEGGTLGPPLSAGRHDQPTSPVPVEPRQPHQIMPVQIEYQISVHYS